MAVDKNWCLSQAIEIAKEHAKSGNTRPVEQVLQSAYDKLKELSEDIEA